MFWPATYNSPVPWDPDIFAGSDVLVTGGLGFIGSALARRLVELGAKVTLVDSLIPEYGGGLFNNSHYREHVACGCSRVCDFPRRPCAIGNRHVLFVIVAQNIPRHSMT